MFGVLAATWAKFLEPQTIFHVLLVLGRLVVALFAIAARHRQNCLILIRHNILEINFECKSLMQKPLTRIELVTSSLPRRRSTTELQRRLPTLIYER